MSNGTLKREELQFVITGALRTTLRGRRFHIHMSVVVLLEVVPTVTNSVAFSSRGSHAMRRGKPAQGCSFYFAVIRLAPPGSRKQCSLVDTGA